jgi:hypothetical protein
MEIRVDILKYDSHCVDFHESHACSTTFCKEPVTKFHENLTVDLVADTASSVKRQAGLMNKRGLNVRFF